MLSSDLSLTVVNRLRKKASLKTPTLEEVKKN